MLYLKSEHLTCKRTMINHLIWIAPLCTAFFALLSGGFVSFQYIGFYWWYAFLLQGTIAILCVLSWQKEERAGKFYSVFSMPINLQKFEWSKNIILAEKLWIAGVFLALFLSLSQVLSPALVVYGVGRMLVGSSLIILASLWQIPLCLLVIRKAGVLLPVIGNALLGLSTIVLVGNTSFWWIWPYCWPAKLAEYFMGIAINGTWSENTEISYPFVALIIVCSVVFYAALSMLDAKMFERYGGEGR